MDESGSVKDSDQQQGEIAEPSAKLQKLTTRRIGGEELCHMDSEPYENFEGLDIDDVGEYNYGSFSNIDSFDDLEDDMQYDASTMMPSSPNAVSVWQPYRGSEPEISHDVLALIDEEADKIEIQRLLEMGVITTVDKYNGQLDVALSAKMVRTWRKKTKVEVGQDGISRSYPAWMRRSRLVGRDFNFLSYREDVYSPASSSSVVKLLPSMALSDGFIRDAVLATLDVSDALQVPQPVPRKVSLDGQDFIILKCLPGQRDASRLWYSFFVQRRSRFCDKVLNIQGLSDTISPKALNLSELANSNRREKRQARTLTVQEVKSLESFMADEQNVMIDRFACGCFLFALFSRSRWSDLRCVYGFASDIIEIEGKIAGYLEYKTRSHKTARLVQRQGLSMPLVAPAWGVGNTPWAFEFAKVAKLANRPLDSIHNVQLLAAPTEDGEWTNRSTSTLEAKRWLLCVLKKALGKDPDATTIHCFKSTALSWAGKAGLGTEVRQVLGHHSTGMNL